jgi:hypothetical protein
MPFVKVFIVVWCTLAPQNSVRYVFDIKPRQPIVAQSWYWPQPVLGCGSGSVYLTNSSGSGSDSFIQ